LHAAPGEKGLTVRRAGRWVSLVAGLLVLGGAVVAWLVTTEAGAAFLLDALMWQSSPASPKEIRARAQAIVVLGGRTNRIDYGARLHLATGVPLLLVGKGTGDSGFDAESEKMEDILLRKYGIGPRWVENESKDTRENAVFAWCLVSSMGVKRIALVTDPHHMPRARRRFKAAGFEVIAAPTPDGEPPRPPLTPASFVPGKAGIAAARRPVREWVGFLFGPLEQLLDPPRACPYTAAPVH
jgi:uncharacterized SAM-binding protein YcdF (DUF218 family)